MPVRADKQDFFTFTLVPKKHSLNSKLLYPLQSIGREEQITSKVDDK